MRAPSLPHAIIAAAALVPTVSFSAGEVNFSREVQPILSDKCFACHGFDPETREADLRLDTFEGATKNSGGICAIVPGDLAKSEAWLRIQTKDEDDIMPPRKSHKALDDREKDVLKRWIEQGAKYQKHWAFEAPKRPSPPAVKDEGWARNAIDRFIAAKLDSVALKPAPEADRRTLARRVWLDLTGLPPSPEEVDAFEKDPAPDAYEQLVRRLMDSPQWGEHRGRYWLDAARYADTHGLHFDNFREMWPYRDWVINAFNRNQPFDLFTVEQIAGDLLPKPTRDQMIATGFQRCNATTNEGGTIDDENLANYANDRVTTLSWVWLGLSANCAACHDHKFDPIRQKDFYSMAAYFRNTTQPPKDGNVRESRPILYLPKQDDEKRFNELQAELAKVRAESAKVRAEAEKEFAAWVVSAANSDLEVSGEKLILDLPLNDDAPEIKSGDQVVTRNPQLTWNDGGKLGRTAVLGSDGLELGDVAGLEKDQAFSVAAWLKLPKDLKTGTIAARFDDRGEMRKGWSFFLEDGKIGLRLSPGDSKKEIRAVTKRGATKPEVWIHVCATYDGSGNASGIRISADGKEQPINLTGDILADSIRADVPLRIGRRESGTPLTGASVQGFRIYGRALIAEEVSALHQSPALRVALATPPPSEKDEKDVTDEKSADPKKPEGRTAAQVAALKEFYLGNKVPELKRLGVQFAALESEDRTLKSRAAVTLIQEEKSGSEAMANILMRGQYDKLGEKVTPATFAALHQSRADAPKNRLGLAQWLVAKENPLTARVTVNRFWQELFGTGLVRTSEDFGVMGERPSHPELLDWLAVEFQESGWDVKRLFTLMVTSATYRQSAVTTPEKRERDPQNRLLSRGPRFRMDAEMIRDYALAASGSLVPKVGGPSVKPYQPEGVWEAVAMPESNTRFYKRDSGEGLYRRSLYTFWKRAAPPALMDILNAPSRETCAVRRERTNTPLQALATLNDPQFVEAARKLAELALKQPETDPERAIGFIAQRVLLRPLSNQERKIVSETFATAEREFNERIDSAKSFLAVGDSKPDASLPAPRVAALSLVANQLLCLDEALNK